MTTTSLPTTPTTPTTSRLSAAARALGERVDGEVRFDAGSRAAYSTDASNYRQVPLGVVVPRTPEAAVEAVAVCREFGLPIVSRGGGTSLAGQCTNDGRRDRLLQVLRPARSRSTRRPARAWWSRASSWTTSTASWRRRAALRAGAVDAHELHPRRDDRQQLVRCHRPAHRQGRRQHRRAGGAALRRHPVHAGPDRATRRTAGHRAARRTAGPQIYRSPAPDPRDEHGDQIRRALPRHPAPGVRLQPGLPAAGERLRHRPGSWSAARPRWSPSCAPSCELVPVVAAPHLGRPRLPRHRRGGGRRPGDPASTTRSRWRASTTTSIHDEQLKEHERLERWTSFPGGNGLPDGPVRRRRTRTRPTSRRRRCSRTSHETRARPDVVVSRRPGPRGAALAGARGRPRRHGATSRGDARHLPGLGGLGRPPGPARGLPARPAGAVRASSATPATSVPASTGTSARAASTPASPSTCTTAEGVATYRRFVERAADLVVSLRRLAVRRAR